MEQELRALLLGTAAIAAQVERRVDWGGRPQGAPMPAIALHLIDSGEGVTNSGPDGLLQGRVQVDCWAESFAEAAALRDLVQARLNGYRGGGFQGVFLVGSRMERDGAAGEAGRPFWASMDFLTNWSASNG